MQTIYKTAILSIFILMSASVTRPQNGEPPTEMSVLNGNKIIGAWQINYAESDDLLLKMQAFLHNKLIESASGKTDAAGDRLPLMSVSLVPPETLVLAGEDEKSITINEGFSEIVFTRTIITDGVKRSGELPDGADFSLTAAQRRGFLKLETASPRGNRMIETYALAAAGKKLVVIVRFENEQAKEMFTLRRIYDRTFPAVFSSEAGEVQ